MIRITKRWLPLSASLAVAAAMTQAPAHAGSAASSLLAPSSVQVGAGLAIGPELVAVSAVAADRAYGRRGYRGRAYRGARGARAYRGARVYRGARFYGRPYRRAARRHFYAGRRFYRPRFYPNRFYGARFYYPGFRPGFYYGGPGFFYGNRFYRRGFGAGDAALLAAGVIGGAILIDNAFDRSEARYTRYDAGTIPNRQGTRSRSTIPSLNGRPLPAERDFDEAPLDDRGADGIPPLEGGAVDGADVGEEIAALGPLDGNYLDAYRLCTNELRDRLGRQGVRVAVPSDPQDGGSIAGGVWRLETEFTMRTASGASYLKRMTCEADETTVGYLEIV